MQNRARNRAGFQFVITVIAGGALLLLGLFSCERATDAIRNWGIKSRESRAKKIEVDQLKQWERDLNLSRTRVLELNQTIHQFVEESNRQGSLSWKIAKAFCDAERYELGLANYRAALRDKAPPPEEARELTDTEKSLPYFREALRKNQLDPNLLFDAGLCFANASKELGWEKERFQTARFLFERMRAAAPYDSRSSYQLAIMLAKVPNPNLRDQKRALVLLKEIITRDEYDISARFAYGHILVERGEFSQALQEYQLIRTRLEELENKGTIPGPLKRNQQYVQAGRNIEELQLCVQDSPRCSIMSGR